MKDIKNYILEARSRSLIQKPTYVDTVENFETVIDGITDDERVTAEVMSYLDEFVDNGKLYTISSVSDDCMEEFNYWTSDEDVFNELMKADDSVVKLSSIDGFAVREINKQRFGWLYNTESGEFVIICTKKGIKFNVI